MNKISIIVPVYNVKKYLNRCIDSILNQSFSDFDLILVDDGSPDNCGKICDGYAEKDKRIKVVHKENGGLASARNAGLDVTDNDYIVFIDSDDQIEQNHIEALFNCVKTTEDNYIFCGMKSVSETDGTYTLNTPDNRFVSEKQIDFLNLHKSSTIGFACNALFYNSVLKKYNIRFNENVIIEDLPFTLEYMKHMSMLSYTGDCTYNYMQHDSTLSNKYYRHNFRRYQEKYTAIMDFCDYIHETMPPEVASTYLYHFLRCLDNTFDNRNDESFFAKIKYNNSVIKSDQFQHCLEHSAEYKAKTPDARILSLKNYFIYYVFHKLILLKSKIVK